MHALRSSRRLALLVTLLSFSIAATSFAGDVQTDGQLISTVASGTPPLAVTSTDLVDNLNADQLDGLEATAFALDADLTAMIAALQAQIDGLQAQIDALVGAALVEETGQTECWDENGLTIACAGTGQDGDIQAGLAWPDPRFTDQLDGTALDNLTGLVWLLDASCPGLFGTDMDGFGSWNEALAASNMLASGTCGLTDGSVAGDWRLPNIKELQSLFDYSELSPSLPDPNPFTGVDAMQTWWSSTTEEAKFDVAWLALFTDGSLVLDGKVFDNLIWPVRDP